MWELGAEKGDVHGLSWNMTNITMMAAYKREQTTVAKSMTYETVW